MSTIGRFYCIDFVFDIDLQKYNTCNIPQKIEWRKTSIFWDKSELDATELDVNEPILLLGIKLTAYFYDGTQFHHHQSAKNLYQVYSLKHTIASSMESLTAFRNWLSSASKSIQDKFGQLCYQQTRQFDQFGCWNLEDWFQIGRPWRRTGSVFYKSVLNPLMHNVRKWSDTL